MTDWPLITSSLLQFGFCRDNICDGHASVGGLSASLHLLPTGVSDVDMVRPALWENFLFHSGVNWELTAELQGLCRISLLV